MQAESNLDALIANDPEHPAIRYFILMTVAVLRSSNLEGRERAAISCLKEEMYSLEKALDCNQPKG